MVKTHTDSDLQRFTTNIGDDEVRFSPRGSNSSSKEGYDKWVAKQGEDMYYTTDNGTKYYYTLGRNDLSKAEDHFENYQHSNYIHQRPYTPSSEILGYVAPEGPDRYGVFKEEMIEHNPGGLGSFKVRSNFLKAGNIQKVDLSPKDKQEIDSYLKKGYQIISDAEYTIDKNNKFRVIDQETFKHDNSAYNSLLSLLAEGSPAAHKATPSFGFTPQFKGSTNQNSLAPTGPLFMKKKEPQPQEAPMKRYKINELKDFPVDYATQEEGQEEESKEEYPQNPVKKQQQEYAQGGSVTMDDLYDALAHTISPYPYNPQLFFSNTSAPRREPNARDIFVANYLQQRGF